jgi:hypothetical protein
LAASSPDTKSRPVASELEAVACQSEIAKGHPWLKTQEIRENALAPPEQQKPSAVSALEERTSNELVRLVRKLRWIGMEEEAETLLRELAQIGSV